MSDVISARRLWLLIRNDAARNSRTIATTSALFAGLVVVGNLLMPSVDSLRDNYYLAWFVTALFAWGLLATSRSFRDLHDKSRNEAYLLIPASALEKTLARLLSLTLIFVPFLLALTFLLSLIVEGLNGLFAREHNALFNAFDPRVWSVISQYVVLQSYYFLGAAWFRRTHFIKTSLAVIVALMAFFVVAFASARLFLGTDWWSNVGAAADALDLTYGPFLDAMLAVAQLVNFVVVPAVCWYTAYLRVRETQVSDGV